MAALRGVRGQWILWGILALCVGIEATLSLSDHGILVPPRLRHLAYEYGGFWPGLLDRWQPNYPSQPALMFATYGFLHAGLAHLGVNMFTLWSLGREVLDRVGVRGFTLVYVGGMLGGGLGFGLLAPDLHPMVGASGALFGIAGALLAWAYVDRFTARFRLWPIGLAVLLLIVLNVVMWWSLDGHIAWQAHLGGFVSGWILALLVDPRARPTA